MLPSGKHPSVPSVLCVLQASISKFVYIYRIKFISEYSENISLSFCQVNKVQVNEQMTDLSFYCIFRKCPNSYGNGVCTNVGTIYL